jgi:hypothetical protein
MKHGLALRHEASREERESEVDAPDKRCSLRDEGAEAEPCAEECVVAVGVAAGGGGVDKEDATDTGDKGAERAAAPLEVGAEEPLGAECGGCEAAEGLVTANRLVAARAVEAALDPACAEMEAACQLWRRYGAELGPADGVFEAVAEAEGATQGEAEEVVAKRRAVPGEVCGEVLGGAGGTEERVAEGGIEGEGWAVAELLGEAEEALVLEAPVAGLEEGPAEPGADAAFIVGEHLLLEGGAECVVGGGGQLGGGL